ncbi:MAG TPA: glycosyltransferase [Pyrinomonadaceae bacterium]|nr:glycosyltransferase [Pyrinomonadaceae bacterium]
METKPFINKKPIKLCALMLYPHDRVPGQRYRIEQWEKYLNEEGIEIDYFSFADEKLLKTMPKNGQILAKISVIGKAFLRRFSQLSALRKYDAIFIYRAAAMVGPALIERIIKLLHKPIIFDFDDAIFLTHTHEANKLFGWAKFAKKTDAICRLSTSVTVGNAWLAEYARKHNKNVTIIPSSVDTDFFVPMEKETRQKVIVGWTGSSTSQTHLEMYVPLLREISQKLPIELHVHSDRSPNLEDVPFVWHKWSADTEVEIISDFDIGIMPMPDDEWSQGKCSMKALLYMSLGVPTVCSDIGMNREVVSNGENGFLAKTNEDWFEAIKTLVENKGLRQKMGEKSRQTVVENYSMKKCAKLFAKVVKDTLTDKT